MTRLRSYKFESRVFRFFGDSAIERKCNGPKIAKNMRPKIPLDHSVGSPARCNLRAIVRRIRLDVRARPRDDSASRPRRSASRGAASPLHKSFMHSLDLFFFFFIPFSSCLCLCLCLPPYFAVGLRCKREKSS